ncbi:MAG TPA: amino acid ABC transporter substrate-binding protein, partial [Desulfobacterales bacterium]|nr:amino acid ABC transporter substrate-binding protein [Desulfobacterales bacterium]
MTNKKMDNGSWTPRKQLFLLLLLLIVAILIGRELLTDRPDQVHITTSGRIDMCLSCHKDEKLDPAHDPRVIGCASCHLGDALAINKEEAHK